MKKNILKSLFLLFLSTIFFGCDSLDDKLTMEDLKKNPYIAELVLGGVKATNNFEGGERIYELNLYIKDNGIISSEDWREIMYDTNVYCSEYPDPYDYGHGMVIVYASFNSNMTNFYQDESLNKRYNYLGGHIYYFQWCSTTGKYKSNILKVVLPND